MLLTRSRRSLAAVVVVLASVFGSVLGAVTLSGASAAVQTGSTATSYAEGAFGATNQRRAEHDLVRLRPSRCLERYAERWARRMGRGVGLVHQGLRPILRRCGLSWVGENIAVGYPTPRAVVRGWMGSPGHRANILRPQFRLMGIGAYRDGDGRWWVSQVFGRAA